MGLSVPGKHVAGFLGPLAFIAGLALVVWAVFRHSLLAELVLAGLVVLGVVVDRSLAKRTADVGKGENHGVQHTVTSHDQRGGITAHTVTTGDERKDPPAFETTDFGTTYVEDADVEGFAQVSRSSRGGQAWFKRGRFRR